jgi:hypothetical protein
VGKHKGDLLTHLTRHPPQIVDRGVFRPQERKDAFDDPIKGIAGKRVGRGSRVRVTVKMIYDDGIADAKRPDAYVAKAGYYVQVSVASITRPGLERNGTIPFDDKSAREIIKYVSVLGGTLAEGLIESYGDKMDPSECAKAAVAAWEEVYAELTKSGTLFKK